MVHGIFLFNFYNSNQKSNPCSAGDPMDETRSIVDRNIVRLEESIRSLEDSIRALKSRRNELSPISRLPAEILCNIFSLRILCSPDSPESWNFSQVSHRWRSLALSAPELWTNIPLSYPRWTREMLIRSKMAKLTIRSAIFIMDLKSIETIRSCLYEMNRVEAIDITCRIPELALEEIFRDLPKSAPQLRTLRIDRRSPAAYLSVTAFSIHEDFLYDTERLQHVELFNCKISWNSRLLSGLTRLTLEVEDAKSSINQFLHALQRMPALTELRLKDSIPDDPEGLSTYPVVDLPCLRLLSISSRVGSLTTVLHHITFPHSAILCLACKENQSVQINFSNFLSVLATKFLSSLVFRSLSLVGFCNAETHGLEFALWTTATIRDYLSFSENSQSQLHLVLTWPPSPQHSHINALTCLFDVMSFPFLTQLHISTYNYIDSQTWVKTFGKLPLLERVGVWSSAMRWFLEALVYKTKAAEKSEIAYRNVTFPKLRFMSLVEANFYSYPTSLHILLDCLMERCERNAEIQVLHFDGYCDISPNDVERLKEIVVDVIGDGVD